MIAVAGWTPVHAWITDLSQMATGSLIAAVWQGVLLAGAAAIGLKLLPKTPAAVRFAIWFAVFALVVALPVIGVWPKAAVASGAGSAHDTWLVLNEGWCLTIAAAWGFASLVRAVSLGVAALRVRALWKRAVPVETRGWVGENAGILCSAQDDSSRESSRTSRESSCTGRRAQVCVSNEVDRPTVIGFFAPKILIPDWLMGKLTEEELENVVLHEAGHLGRADDWINLIQKIALVLFPLNPVLAWVERRLCFERELAVDERVLKALADKDGAHTAYASCLATLAEYRLQRRGFTQALVLGVLGRESELGHRVMRILERRPTMKPMHAKLVLGGATMALLVAATGLEHCPQVVGFADQGHVTRKQLGSEIAAGHLIAPPAGFRAVAVKAEVAAPEWKTVGDAEPELAKPNRSKHLEAKARVSHPILTAPNSEAGRAEEVRASDRGPRDSDAQDVQPVRVVQTFAAQQISPDGQVTVTRMVRVTSWGAAAQPPMQGSRQRQQAAAPVQQVLSVYPYAAVPVQGGWLIFQL